MPQMAPMNWIIMFFTLLVLFFTVKTLLYFLPFNLLNKILSSKLQSSPKNFLMWKW